MKPEERQQRFTWKENEAYLVTNDLLICRDCVFKTSHTGRCNGFVVEKPLSVFEQPSKCVKYITSIDGR